MIKPQSADASRPFSATVTLSDVLAAVSVRVEKGKQRIERANGNECEIGHGGWGYDNFITTCDFILNSKCANIVWRSGCERTRKGILSVPMDSQSHATRERNNPLTPLAAVMGVCGLEWTEKENGQEIERRTGMRR